MSMMTKLVNVNACVSVRNTNPPIYGVHTNIVMSTGDILKCLCRRAIVDEILPDGSTVRLTMRNYYTDNGAGLDAQKTLEALENSKPKVLAYSEPGAENGLSKEDTDDTGLAEVLSHPEPGTGNTLSNEDTDGTGLTEDEIPDNDPSDNDETSNNLIDETSNDDTKVEDVSDITDEIKEDEEKVETSDIADDSNTDIINDSGEEKSNDDTIDTVDKEAQPKKSSTSKKKKNSTSKK